MVRAVLASLLLPAVHADVPAKLRPLSEGMQAMLDSAASAYNASLQVAFRSQDGFFELASGDMTTSSLVPLGSVTKPWTCTALLRAAEQGTFSLDEPAHLYIDPVLQAENGTTLAQLWDNEAINSVTTRHLCHHSSGVADYDGLQNLDIQLRFPEQNESPLDYLHLVDKTLACSPGKCSCYSGIGFILAGYVLAGLQKASSWKDMDQMAFLPDALRARWQPNMVFAKEGKCSEYDRVVHQWFPSTDANDSSKAVFADLYNYSCLNGWTMGNLATTAGVLADFHWELFHGAIINQSSLKEMRTYDDFSQGCWAAGALKYGLGLERPEGSVWDTPDYQWEGHGGQDYGSKADLCGYNQHHDFTFCITINAAVGMNCSSAQSLAQGLQTGTGAFYIYDLAVKWQQNHSSTVHAPLADVVNPRPARPEPISFQRLSPLVEAAPASCDGKPDYAFEWELTSNFLECKYSEIAHVFYRASLEGSDSMRLKQYANRFCLNAVREDVVPLTACANYPGQPFTSSVQFVYDASSPNKVTEKIWATGGITSCEWRSHAEVPAAQQPEQELLV